MHKITGFRVAMMLSAGVPLVAACGQTSSTGNSTQLDGGSGGDGGSGDAWNAGASGGAGGRDGAGGSNAGGGDGAGPGGSGSGAASNGGGPWDASTDGDAASVDGDAGDGQAPLDCDAAKAELAALDTPTACATDLDCTLLDPYSGGVFVAPDDEASALDLLATTDALGQSCFGDECAVDGESQRGRCRSGQCTRVIWGCNGPGPPGDGGLGVCGSEPAQPVDLGTPANDDEWLQAACLLGTCWAGSFVYAIGGGVTRTVEIAPSDAGECRVTITEEDGQGWGQRKVCPGPDAHNWWDLDYFVLVEPADCAITPL